MTRAESELWVFAYGSLMWRPGFAYEQAQHARVTGYRRCFCIYSTHHRGTPARPGLVLGLDRGGTCEGIAYRVAAANAQGTIRYLRQREQISGVYSEKLVPIELMMGQPGAQVLALAYIVERAHPSYAGQLPVAVQARLIEGAKGVSGANLDYLVNTLRHLAELGIRERQLERVLATIGPHMARAAVPELGASASARTLLGAMRSRPVSVHVRRLKPDQRRRFLYRLRLNSDAKPSTNAPSSTWETPK